MLNKFYLDGFMITDCTLQESSKGKKYLRGAISVGKRTKNDKGEVSFDNQIFDFAAFNQLAENMSKYVNKGDRVILEGSLSTSSYVMDESLNQDGVLSSRERTIYQIDLVVTDFTVTHRNEKEETPGQEDDSNEGGEKSILEKYEEMKATPENTPGLVYL